MTLDITDYRDGDVPEPDDEEIEDNGPTPVIFRRAKVGIEMMDYENEEVIAIFPAEVDTADGKVSFYAPSFQHSSGHIHDLLANSRPVHLKADYAALKEELERIGYRLRVCKRDGVSLRRERSRRTQELRRSYGR